MLKEFRERHGLSQEDLAKRLNCTQGKISHLETGKNRIDISFADDFIQVAETMGETLTYNDIFKKPDQAAA